MLGWVSFFTDTASEMIYPLLPLFLTRVLGAGAMSLGVIEGVAEAANSVLKIVSGRLADRTGTPKRLVLAGYGLTGDDAIDATRAMRSALHGFVMLEHSGGFRLPRDLDRTFDQMVAALDRCLAAWPSLVGPGR